MRHDPERLAAAYLAAMRPQARRRFETHLLACESCWREVSLARRGLEFAESGREVAPPLLREHIRAAVAGAAARHSADRLRVRRPAAVAAAAVIVAVAGTAMLARPWQHPAAGRALAPAGLAAAVTSYRTDQLPGTSDPAGQAPDLTRLNLRLVAGAAGRIDSVTVTMFVYRAPSGARLALYRSGRPFAEAPGAHELGHAETAAWTMHSGGITVLCVRGNHAVLLLGSDPALVRRAAVLLNAI